MKSIIKSAAYILLIAAVTFASCKKMEKVSSPPPPSPTIKSIVANAGIDQTITLPTDSVTLDGSTSTGAINSYKWTEISGPTSSSIQNASAVKTVVKKLVQGVYQFELEVTDNGGLTAKDTVQINLASAQQDTLKGQEIIYDNLIWETADFFGLGINDVYVGIPVKPPANLPFKVSIKLDTSQIWIDVPFWDDHIPIPQNTDYIYDNNIHYSTLFVFGIANANHQLVGTKLSIKIKFL